jgi:hypothetical protein
VLQISKKSNLPFDYDSRRGNVSAFKRWEFTEGDHCRHIKTWNCLHCCLNVACLADLLIHQSSRSWYCRSGQTQDRRLFAVYITDRHRGLRRPNRYARANFHRSPDRRCWRLTFSSCNAEHLATSVSPRGRCVIFEISLLYQTCSRFSPKAGILRTT